MDFAYMDQIIQFNKDDMDIVVQPSIGWQDLNERLATMGSGLFFPVDPGQCLVDFVVERDYADMNTRPECQNRWHDRDQLLWYQRGQVRNHEGLGHQLDSCSG